MHVLTAIKVMFTLQIVAEASIPSIPTESVWDHFVKVMVPVIQMYQVQLPAQKESTLGQALVSFAEAMHLQHQNSEVSERSLVSASNKSVLLYLLEFV